MTDRVAIEHVAIRATTHNLDVTMPGPDGRPTLHRFATYTGAHFEEYTVSDHTVHAVLSDRSTRLEVTASRPDGGILRAPTLTQMDRRITETLSAQVQVKLSHRQGSRWPVDFDDTGRHAGLEVNGKLNFD